MERQGAAKIFNDSVHGHITIPPICVKIIDTPAFQRLRNIKQMGVTHLVFPGACNTRFEHSLGTCFLAGRMVDALNSNSDVKITEEEKECLQIAGLCHDVGHGPFSHMWDRVVGSNDYHHEEVSLNIFDYISSQNGFLEELSREVQGFPFTTRRDLIKRMIQGIENPAEESFGKKLYLFQVVANKQNGIDVDKWDSFLRDGLHLNLKTTFDYRRLLEFCRIQMVPDGTMQICFRTKEAYNLYDMFVNRATLHHKAYQHPVKNCIEEMLIDAFLKHEETLPVERKWSTISIKSQNARNGENQEFLEDFLRLTDDYTIRAVQDGTSEEAKEILSRIFRRKLYERIPERPVRIRPKQKEAIIRIFQRQHNQQTDSLYRLNFIQVKLGSEQDNPIGSIFFYSRDGRQVESKTLDEVSIFDPAPSGLKYMAVQVLYRGHEATHSPREARENIIRMLSQQTAVL